jgi:uncharacterized RDD family membrane protein YckC
MNYAGFWKRFLASFIDGLILLIPSFALRAVTGGSAAGFGLGFGISFGSGLIIGFLYRPFFESSAMEATPGKALLNLSVKSESGARLTFKQACIRHFASYLSMLILYVGYLMQPFTARRQTLHDMLAEAVVVQNTEPAPDLNYFKVWKEQFQAVMDRL